MVRGFKPRCLIFGLGLVGRVNKTLLFDEGNQRKGMVVIFLPTMIQFSGKLVYLQY